MRQRHPRISRSSWRSGEDEPLLFEVEEDLYVPKAGWGFRNLRLLPGSRVIDEQRARRVVGWFGYPANSLAVQTC